MVRSNAHLRGSGANPFCPSGLATTSKDMPQEAAWARKPLL